MAVGCRGTDCDSEETSGEDVEGCIEGEGEWGGEGEGGKGREGDRKRGRGIGGGEGVDNRIVLMLYQVEGWEGVVNTVPRYNTVIAS